MSSRDRSVPRTGHTHLDYIVAEIATAWPQHARHLRASIAEREPDVLAFSNRLAGIIRRLGEKAHGGIGPLVEDYRFLCESIVVPEELHFRRHGQYRLTRFDDANRLVYSDRAFMTRYMNGLLVSDVIWVNHCRCMMNYSTEFLATLPEATKLLEIGPGHGLLLYLADDAAQLESVAAWDVSDASLALAANTLQVLGTGRPVQFEKRDIFDAAIMDAGHAGQFGAIVLSEVLEHLEDPLGALRVLFHLCQEGGRVWINVPANSPAPDHLYLVSDLAEPAELLRRAGFEIVDQVAYATSGTSVEKAVKNKLTFNCVITGRKPRRENR